jgi:hypothetical protein
MTLLAPVAGSIILVALFLAEAIRSRRTSLPRAAEISQRVVANMAKMNSEDQALAMLTDIEKDFEEVSTLKQALHFGYEPSDVKVYQSEIKEYAAKVFIKDMNLSTLFLQDSAMPGMTIQQLCLKYPDFCNFLAYSQKAEMIPNMRPQPV